MRTTVDIPDAIFRTAKRVAVEKGCTMRELIADALTHELAGRVVASVAKRRPLPAVPLPRGAPILRMTVAELAAADADADVRRAHEMRH